MMIVGFLWVLFLQSGHTQNIGHYTVVNIHNEDGTKETVTNTDANGQVCNLPPFQNCTSNLNSLANTLEGIISKLDNVSKQLLSNEAKLEYIAKQVENETRPRDCNEIQSLGYKLTGEYTIYPKPGLKGFQVRCDMDTTFGGWTVIQRRVSDSDFFKTWNEYKYGFGDVNENYWLGNEAIHMVSTQGIYKLRVDLTSMGNEKAYAEYDFFSVGDSTSNYLLKFGKYSGNAGDSLRRHNNKMFSTKDRNNDVDGKEDCAKVYLGAWWYTQCHDVNLNGDYGNKAYAKGPVWQHWKGDYAPLKETEMKIRPV